MASYLQRPTQFIIGLSFNNNSLVVSMMSSLTFLCLWNKFIFLLKSKTIREVL